MAIIFLFFGYQTWFVTWSLTVVVDKVQAERRSGEPDALGDPSKRRDTGETVHATLRLSDMAG